MREDETIRRTLLRHIPNAISIGRLCANGILVSAAALNRPEVFKWVLLGCLLSDVADGLIARTFKISSKLGSFLDSLADVATMFVAVLGVLHFQRSFLVDHYPGLLLVVGLYVAEVIASLLRYGRLSSFHTVMARTAAFSGGVFVMWLFLWGYQGWLYHVTTLLFALSLIEEMLLIYLLPSWQSDVGGIYRLPFLHQANIDASLIGSDEQCGIGFGRRGGGLLSPTRMGRDFGGYAGQRKLAEKIRSDKSGSVQESVVDRKSNTSILIGTIEI
jgi:CDP-diacylglycerol--glycerol-3-phosphate 3-phosphatidyltransferase